MLMCEVTRFLIECDMSCVCIQEVQSIVERAYEKTESLLMANSENLKKVSFVPEKTHWRQKRTTLHNTSHNIMSLIFV